MLTCWQYFTSIYLTFFTEFTHGSINKHLLNTIYTLINLIFCAKPMQILHIYQPVIYGLIYLLFSFVYNIVGYAPIYTVLDWSKTGKALMVSCLSLFIGIPLMYLVCFSIQTLRIYISMKLDCLAQPEFDKRQKRDISANDEQLKDTPKPNQVYTINLSNIVWPDSLWDYVHMLALNLFMSLNSAVFAYKNHNGICKI